MPGNKRPPVRTPSRIPCVKHNRRECLACAFSDWQKDAATRSRAALERALPVRAGEDDVAALVAVTRRARCAG